MPGAWLALVGRRLLREDTFLHIVAPGIADLQQEAERGILARIRHRAGILAALAIALVQDLWRDTRDVWLVLTQVWMRVAGVYALVAMLFALPHLWSGTPWHLLGGGGRLAAGVLAVVTAVLATTPFALAVTTFFLRRAYPTWRRTLIPAVLAFLLAAPTLNIIALPARTTLGQIAYGSISSEISREAILPDDPRQQYLAAEWKRWSVWRAQLLTDRCFFCRPSVWQTAAFGTLTVAYDAVTGLPSALAFALCGIVIARGRGVGVLLRSVGLAATFTLLLTSLFRLDAYVGLFWLAPLGWLAGMQLTTALIWMAAPGARRLAGGLLGRG